MRALIFFPVAVAVSSLVHAEALSSSVDLADPSTLVSDPTCVSQCQAVYADCRLQCGEDTVHAREEQLNLGNASGGECLERCQSDLAICRQSCGENR